MLPPNCIIFQNGKSVPPQTPTAAAQATTTWGCLVPMEVVMLSASWLGIFEAFSSSSDARRRKAKSVVGRRKAKIGHGEDKHLIEVHGTGKASCFRKLPQGLSNEPISSRPHCLAQNHVHFFVRKHQPGPPHAKWLWCFVSNDGGMARLPRQGVTLQSGAHIVDRNPIAPVVPVAEKSQKCPSES